ncbi:MAG: PH domain-containing protein, partial [Bryobacteraceae bacterium]|nr:PH domain-containing protein [Bryobacteraceae bacterium]
MAIVYFFNNNRSDPVEALLVVPLLVFLWTVWRHVQQYFTVMTITGGKLRYETGIVSKTTRTLDVAKIQDVRVEQSMVQRLVNVGKLGIETTGERGGLSMNNVDRPQQ